MRTTWPRMLRLALIACAAASPAAAGGSEDERKAKAERRAFIERYHCEITTRLGIIRDTPAIKDRFIAVYPTADRGDYVQCILNETGGLTYCEAASGYYRVPENEPWTPAVPEEARAALQQLGFQTKIEQGNLWQEIEIKGGRDLDGVADVILGALYDVYGARLGMELEVNAPLAKLKGLMSPTCTPSS